MKYIEASVQVVDLENQDVVTASPAQEKALVDELKGIFGSDYSLEDLKSDLAGGGFNNGIDGLLAALEVNGVNLNQLNGQTFADLHKKACQHSKTDSSAFSNDAEEFEKDDMEW